MSKYLVVLFDRTETHKSKSKFIEADSSKEAAIKSTFTDAEDLEDDSDEDYKFRQVNKTFACRGGEEYDVLIYLLD